MRSAWFIVIAVASVPGCNAILGVHQFGDADATGSNGSDAHLPADAARDATPDGPPTDASVCFGTRIRACFASAPTGDVVIQNNLDTDTDSRCIVMSQGDGPPLCVIAGATITATANLTNIAGTRPLVLVAAGDLSALVIDVTGVSSRLPVGFSAGSCGTPGTASTVGNLGGGGAGGSFGTMGGQGGAGDGLAATGGAPSPAIPPNLAHAGCPGGAGAKGGSTSVPGAGGNGGGAVALIAGGVIGIDEILANGAGGAAGGVPNSGGGGGGTGGFISLEASSLARTPILRAMGGGGGGGAAAAAAGSAGTAGGAGGGGAAGAGGGGQGGGALGPGTGANGNHGGGGAGGGAGAIWVTVPGGSVDANPPQS